MTSNNIIAKLKNISVEITKHWSIIKSENVAPKGYARQYDLKKVIARIAKLSDDRIQHKLYQQAINMGYTSMKDFPSNSNYVNIFTLSELREQYVQLGLVKTIDPNLKAKKGKAKLNNTEELTAQYIANLRAAINLKIVNVTKKLDDFNNAAELDITKPSELLVA